MGTIQHADNGTLTELADLAQWEADNDPNAGQPSTQGPQGAPSNDSNPTGLLVTSTGELLAVDAGGNTVLEVDTGSGEVTGFPFPVGGAQVRGLTDTTSADVGVAVRGDGVPVRGSGVPVRGQRSGSPDGPGRSVPSSARCAKRSRARAESPDRIVPPNVAVP